MPRQCNKSLSLDVASALTFAAAALLAGSLDAASTGTTALFRPQGSNSSTAFGDYVSDAGGLDTSYRYYVEVPSGLSRLVIDIFDADIGIGGGGEAAAQRDRDRGTFDTAASYTLFDPSGVQRLTRFTLGNATAPTGADNAWLALYNGTGNNVRDNFTTAAFSNNDGNNNWTGNWIEVDSGGAGAAAGAIRVTGGELRIQDDVSGSPSIEREADLSGSPGLNLQSAWFSFTYRTSGNLEDSDLLSVQVSGNGGASWTTLETFFNDTSGSRNYDITSFIANNTRIRFLTAGNLTGSEFFYFDNVQIHDGGSITAGHWEVRVDQSSAVTNGNSINAFGLRAHDGTSGAGGTELNVYADSHSQIGVNPPGSGTLSNSYTLYPYFTSGCTIGENDFDYDSNSGTVGSIQVTSRTAAFTTTVASASLSANDTWARNSFSGWTSDTNSGEFGIWSSNLTITSYLVGGTPNGNYSNPYFTNSSAAANPPTANPTTNAFRVYLPTDAPGAPVKPYLEQFLRYGGCGASNGPNPPAVGQTSCFTVTVRLVNPAAQAITLSAANLVTANIPGAGAVYADTAQVSQGSVVSQPAVGGTGNITWNPGTVAAGATVLLAYHVNVTPTSAGQRIPVTATPASGNGTRARYVDETGNTTQARATYQQGPLCELAATAGLLTYATVAELRATPADQGVVVEWETAAEVGTLGFDLLRWEASAGGWRKVHGEPLTTVPESPVGGRYRFVDRSADPRQPQRYRLVEVRLDGGRLPLAVAASAAGSPLAAVPRDAETFTRSPRPLALASRPPAPAPTSAKTDKRPTAKPEALAIGVAAPGLYFVGAGDLANGLDTKPEKVAKNLARGRFALTLRGQPVAWLPAADASGLYFYGEGIDNLYTADNVYRLRQDSGTLMPDGSVAPATPAAGGSFTDLVRSEQDAFAGTVVATDPDSDYWFWDYVTAGDPTHGSRTFAAAAPDPDATGSAQLRVDLFGVTASGVAGEHHAFVRLNGNAVGDTQWTGIGAHSATFDVPIAMLSPTGDNSIEIEGQLGAGAPSSAFYVEGFDVQYPRRFHAAGDALALTAASQQAVTVDGFAASPVSLFDITNPRLPRRLVGATTDGAAGAYQLSFAAEAAASRYFALSSNALRAPHWLRPDYPSDLRSPLRGADYLVITTAELLTPASNLAALRAAQGLRTAVVDVQDVWDELNDGFPDPHVLRAFLAYTSTQWSPAPRFVVLAGNGTFDYKNHLGLGGNLLPPLMVRTSDGLFAADSEIADLNGDGVPDLAIGRLPVRSAAELAAYVAKLAAFEASPTAAWQGEALLVADAPSGGADFGADSEDLAASLPSGFVPERIYLGNTSLAAARADLLTRLDSGAALVSFAGHGALDRWTAGGLLTAADVPGLVNGERLPVIVALTCIMNRFEEPQIVPLGSLLVNRGGGGAAAVWASSGLSQHAEAKVLGQLFLQELGRPAATRPRLGEAIAGTLARYAASGTGLVDMLHNYNLLGDPALLLAAPPEISVPPGPTGPSGE